VLTVYVAALIFGLGAFAIQLLFSSEVSHEPSDLLGGGDVADAGAAPQHGAEAGWASIFSSLRFYMFAAIGLGVVGAPATWLDLSTPAWTLAAALATAMLVGFGSAFGFRLLGRQTLSSGVGVPELEGQVGRVLLACEKGRRGKVRLQVRGQSIDYIATTDDERLGPGAVVIVQEVHGEKVHVCAAPIELLPE
jgi:membrane protein implicated in regulation of membrane protease activity